MVPQKEPNARIPKGFFLFWVWRVNTYFAFYKIQNFYKIFCLFFQPTLCSASLYSIYIVFYWGFISLICVLDAFKFIKGSNYCSLNFLIVRQNFYCVLLLCAGLGRYSICPYLHSCPDPYTYPHNLNTETLSHVSANV